MEIYDNFYDKGYIIIKKFISKDDISLIYSEIDNILTYSLSNISNNDLSKKTIDQKYLDLKKKNPKLKSHCYNMFSNIPTLHRIFSSKNIIEILQKIINKHYIIDKMQIRIDDNSNDRILPMHQERGQISFNEITAWLPLIDITESSGGIYIIPESHKLGRLPVKIYDNGYTGVEDKYIKNVQKVLIEKGDLLLFHWDIIHGSYKNIDPNIRWTAVCRFNPVQNIPYLVDNNAPINIPKDQE